MTRNLGWEYPSQKIFEVGPAREVAYGKKENCREKLGKGPACHRSKRSLGFLSAENVPRVKPTGQGTELIRSKILYGGYQ